MTDAWYTDAQATLGDRISAAREASGMTQAQLAQRLGVRVKTLTDWEDDLSEPRANRLQMLAALLGMSLRWLMTGEGDDLPAPDAAPHEGQGMPRAALTEMRDLRRELLTMAERLGRLEKSLRSMAAAEVHDDR